MFWCVVLVWEGCLRFLEGLGWIWLEDGCCFSFCLKKSMFFFQEVVIYFLVSVLQRAVLVQIFYMGLVLLLVVSCLVGFFIFTISVEFVKRFNFQYRGFGKVVVIKSVRGRMRYSMFCQKYLFCKDVKIFVIWFDFMLCLKVIGNK